MSATFACPHCGATYPVKPVLVGRAVRCTSCKNPFRLRADGIADKVEDEVPPPPPAPPAPAPAPVAAQQPAASPRPPSATAPGTARSTRLAGQAQGAEQREAQRKALAASLSTAANAALSAESVKAEANPKKKTDRVTKPKKEGGGEGGVGNIAPAILSNYGELEHRNNLMWLFGAIGTVAVITALFFLIGLKSPQRKALERFSAVVEGERTRYGERMLAIQERAWVTGVPPLTDLGTLRIGSTRALPLGPLKGLFTETLKDLTYLPTFKLWAPSDKAAEVEKLWNAKKDQVANLERLASAKLRIVEQATVAEQLTSAGWNEDDTTLLMQLLTGHTNRSGENWIAKKFFAGDLPERIELCSFTGTKGNLLIDLGRAYKSNEIDYSGRLLRFIGQGWTDEWKVMEIKTSSRK